MRPYFITFICLCSAALAFVTAVPIPGSDQELDVLQIPLTNGKELDVLTLGAHDQEQLIAERNKRTIGLLRDLFPDITKQIDDQANMIIAKILRTLGPTILRTAVQGNTANRARASFDADFDDDDDDNSSSGSSNSTSSSSTTSTSSSGTRVSIELPTFEPEDEENEIDSGEKSTSTSTSTTESTSTDSATSTGDIATTTEKTK